MRFTADEQVDFSPEGNGDRPPPGTQCSDAGGLPVGVESLLQPPPQNSRHNPEEQTRLIENCGIVALHVDVESRLRCWTKPVEDRFGLTGADRGRHLSEVASKLPGPDLQADVAEALENLEEVERETDTRDGEPCFLRKTRPFRDQADLVDGVAIVFDDISARKVSEVALRKSADLFRTIFDRAGLGIAQISPGGRVWHANPALCRMFEYSPGELTRRTLGDICHPDDLPATAHHLRRLCDGAAESFSLEQRGRCRSGNIIWVRLTTTVIRAHDGRVSCFESIFEDITRRRAAEHKLQAFMRDLERQVELRTWSVNILQQTAVVANESDSVHEALRRTLESVCTHLGWPLGRVLLPDAADPDLFVDADIWFTDSDDRFREVVATSREVRCREGVGFLGEVIATRSARWFAGRPDADTMSQALAFEKYGIRDRFAIPVLVRDNVVGLLEFFVPDDCALDPAVINGLTEIGTQLGRVVERKQLEKEVADATAHEQQALGRDLHDSVVQQLTGVNMLAERLRIDLSAEGSASAERAGEIVRQLTYLQQQVRQISHGLMPVEIDPQGLTAALQKLSDSCKAFYGVRCRFHCPQPVLVENGLAANQIYRIAQEAVQNAARHASPHRITIRLDLEGQTARMSVSDNGTGFAGTVEEVGGIGFRIMRHRAGLVQGTLDIRSQPGRGTTVACRFPTSS